MYVRRAYNYEERDFILLIQTIHLTILATLSCLYLTYFIPNGKLTHVSKWLNFKLIGLVTIVYTPTFTKTNNRSEFRTKGDKSGDSVDLATTGREFSSLVSRSTFCPESPLISDNNNK